MGKQLRLLFSLILLFGLAVAAHAADVVALSGAATIAASTASGATYSYTGSGDNLQLPASSSLPSGWTIVVDNNGTGNLVLIPSGETIGGAATLTIPTGGTARVYKDPIGFLRARNYSAGASPWTGSPAAPPAIGGTTPAAGAFTTLAASGAVSGNGITALFASPPALGGTAPAAVTSNSLVVGTDSAVTTGLPRTVLEVSSGPLATVTTGKNLKVFKLPVAVIIENYESVVYSLTGCNATGAVIRLYDCGTSAPNDAACSGGTQLTTVNGGNATGTAVDGTISQASVAAGHYVGFQIQASNSCTAINFGATAVARPQ